MDSLAFIAGLLEIQVAKVYNCVWSEGTVTIWILI